MALVMGVEDLSGRTFGRYKLLEFLGKGAMGAVYRAYDTSLKRDVAVKVLLPELAVQPDYPRLFRSEAEIAASLNHPHIIKVYDYGEHDGYYYIVMQLVITGSSLDDFLISDHLLPSIERLAAMLEQMANALDYAHRQGVIHRDVKPSNVMLDENEYTYLSDFGIAKLVDTTTDFTQQGVIRGSLRFLAPERWEGKEASPATDQYALGIVAYMLLTGQLPFDAAETPALMRQHFYQQPAPVQDWQPELPESMNRVLRTAMAKKPQDRYPTAKAFAEAFRQAAGLLKTPPPPPVPLLDDDEDTTVLRRTPAQRMATIALATLLVLLLVVVGVYIISNPLPGPTEIAQNAVYQTETAIANIAPAMTETPTQTEAISPSPIPSDTPTPPPTRTPAPTVTPTNTATALPLICPYSPPSRLTVGSTARVVAGQAPNVIRDAPNTASARVGEIPAGQIFAVLNGPQCGPTIGRMWWQVSYQGIIGWTTEGSGDTYFLEPVVGTPSAVQPTPTDTPWPPPSAFVTPVRQTMSGALANAADSVVHTFVWQRDTAIQIEVESVDFDTFLTLQYPDGSLLTDDDSAGQLDSLIGPVVLPADGSYTIRINSRNSLFGDYILTYTDYSVCGHLPIAIVEGNDVRLHTGPGIFDPILRLAQRGECLAVAGRSGDGQGLNVNTAYGQTAWISASVVEIIGDVERAPVVNP